MHKTLLHLPQTFFILLYSPLYLPPVSSDVLPFSLIECNSIPYSFLLKTHILLSFSNHELYFISSFCRLVNINHPKLLCYLHFLSLKVSPHWITFLADKFVTDIARFYLADVNLGTIKVLYLMCMTLKTVYIS